MERAARLTLPSTPRRSARAARGARPARWRAAPARAGRRRRARSGPAVGASGSDGEARGQARDERAEGEHLEQRRPRSRPGPRPRPPRRARTRPTVGRVGAAARSSATAPRRSRAVTVSAWTSAYRHTRPTASPTPRSTAASTARNAALSVCAAPTRPERGAEVDQPARHLRRGRRRRAARTTTCGLQVGPQRRAAGPGWTQRDPAVVLERAHDARDAEADLAAVGDLRREHRARAAARARRPCPTPTSTSFGPRIRRPSASGGSSNSRVVAGVGDEPHRLAEPERVRGVDAVALADRVHARQSRAPRARAHRVERDRELVALADRPRVLAQPLEQRREREHQRHDAGADRDRRDGREPARRGPRWRSARRARTARGRRRGGGPARRRGCGARDAAAGEVAAAQDLDRRAARGAPGRPGRGGDDDRDDAGQRERAAGRASARPGPSSFSAASSSAAGRATISAPSAMPSAAAGHRDERRLGRLLGRDPAGAEAERALHAEAGQAALDVGVRARGEHRPGRDQRHERERDEQRDHDPRGLREQDLHARAGDELQLARAPNVTARAWVSVTSAFDGSLSHSSATFGRTRAARWPRACSAR